MDAMQEKMMETQSITNQLRQATGQPVFIQQTRLQQLIDWVISNPSIPLSLRKQFMFLWEVVPLGNYTDIDILFLMSKFREWTILIQWYVPESEWGYTQTFPGDSPKEVGKNLDMSVLFNELHQLYFINLTRGRNGFTTKELNTNRSFTETGINLPGAQSKGLRLF